MSLHETIVAVERQRCDAMLAKDGSVLEALIDPRLHFSHATGSVDDKALYLQKLAGGRIDYLSIDWNDAAVIDLGDTALLTGRMTSRVRVEGVEKHLDNRVLAAWARDGDRWQLVAFQPTPLKS